MESPYFCILVEISRFILMEHPLRLLVFLTIFGLPELILDFYFLMGYCVESES
jgi:hypothetical protein